MNHPLLHGSRPLTHDHRDFKLQTYFGALSLGSLPARGLGRKPFSLNNQSYTQFCTACTTSEANAFLRGVPISVDYARYTGLLTAFVQYQQREIEALKPAAKTATDNWQWGTIAMLICWNIALTIRRRR